jgi:transposase
MEKIYSDEVVNKVVKSYTDGISFSKIATILKIGRDNVKDILIKNNVWVENRDKLKKEFNDVEINDILIKYVNGLSIQKICNLYNVSKTPIQKILKDNEILREGRSDGVKIDLTDEQKEKIKHLYLNEYKNSEEIAEKLGLTKSFICKYLQLTDYRRSVSVGASVGLVRRYRGTSYDKYLDIQNDFKKYKNDVMKITRQQPINELINYDKRGKSGVDGAYQLDHKYSILEGFKNGVSPEIIGRIVNLEFIPWEENIKKRTKCSITINELIL